jgi:hypothetical protein
MRAHGVGTPCRTRACCTHHVDHPRVALGLVIPSRVEVKHHPGSLAPTATTAGAFKKNQRGAFPHSHAIIQKLPRSCLEAACRPPLVLAHPPPTHTPSPSPRAPPRCAHPRRPQDAVQRVRRWRRWHRRAAVAAGRASCSWCRRCGSKRRHSCVARSCWATLWCQQEKEQQEQQHAWVRARFFCPSPRSSSSSRCFPSLSRCCCSRWANGTHGGLRRTQEMDLRTPEDSGGLLQGGTCERGI